LAFAPPVKIASWFLGLLFVVSVAAQAAEEVEYSPGGEQWAATWKTFYAGDYEAELMTPLIEAGRAMVPAVMEAIDHQDMRLRRYAIGALGHLEDERAVAPLTAILADESEEEYFRGDALVAIYQIDQSEGTELAKKYAGQGDTMKVSSEAILKKEPWLLDGD
jgi:HEAT repeat protein